MNPKQGENSLALLDSFVICRF